MRREGGGDQAGDPDGEVAWTWTPARVRLSDDTVEELLFQSKAADLEGDDEHGHRLEDRALQTFVYQVMNKSDSEHALSELKLVADMIVKHLEAKGRGDRWCVVGN